MYRSRLRPGTGGWASSIPLRLRPTGSKRHYAKGTLRSRCSGGADPPYAGSDGERVRWSGRKSSRMLFLRLSSCVRGNAAGWAPVTAAGGFVEGRAARDAQPELPLEPVTPPM